MNPNQEPDQVEMLLGLVEMLQREIKDLQSSKLGMELKGFGDNVSTLRHQNDRLMWSLTKYQASLLFMMGVMLVCAVWWFNQDWRDHTRLHLVRQTRVDFLKAHPVLQVEGTLSPLLQANEEEWSQLQAIGTCMVERRKKEDPKAKNVRCLPEPTPPKKSKKRRRKTRK